VGWCVVMAVQAGNGLGRPAPVGVGIGRLAAAGVRLRRRMRAGLSGLGLRPGGEGPVGPQAATGAADLIRQSEREQVLAQARVHGMVAIQISELMQGNVGRREDLRRQLVERQDRSDLSAAWLCSRIEELDRLITQQVATVDWHLRESRRLRQRIGAE